MMNEAICRARKLWYDLYEPQRLKLARLEPEDTGDSPLVSVYIPTFNRADLLISRALPSVCGQSYENLEIIVAAHGCTDDTSDLVRQISEKDSRIRLIEVERRRTYPPTAENHWLAGPVVPANAALRQCRGDWIARIDDDDTWTADHISVLLSFARAGQYEFVSAMHSTNKGIVQPYRFGETKIGGTQTWLYRSYLKFFRYNPDCWRKKWDRVNDTDLQARMYNAGVRMGYLPFVVARIEPRPGETEVGSRAYLTDAEAKERQLAFR
jgi:glycosyltransferase involved in cell wall biosynthesis